MSAASPSPPQSLRIWRIIFLACTLVLAMAIFFVCTRPLQTLKDANYPQINEWFDLGNHLIAFFVWNGVLRLGLGIQRPLVLLLIGVSFGSLCELAQLAVPTRGFQWMDMAANTLPAAMYFLIPKLKTLGAEDQFPIPLLLSFSKS